MGDTSIAWTDKVWNPVVGCTKVSQGCKNCYAERIFHRPYPGRKFTDVRCLPERLNQPLLRKKPWRIFVNSMSDLFHEAVPDEFIERVFAVMFHASRHTFQVLTKRPGRMREWMQREADRDGVLNWPPQNVWLGVSVEDQATADERIPLLLQTPAAVRFVSYEPALGPIDWTKFFLRFGMRGGTRPEHSFTPNVLEWVIVGGESGPKARPFDIGWARSTIKQCKEAGTAAFCKQLGSLPVEWSPVADATMPIKLKHRSGADPAEWPEDLRIREYPA